MFSSYLSLAIIAAVVLGWILLVFKITVIRYFKLRRQVDESETGRPVNGTIISVKKAGRGRMKMVQLTAEFPNLSQTIIREDFKFVDSKPEENRYEEGRRITLLIDDQAKGGPVAKIAGGKTVIGKGFLLISAILLSGTLYGAWYLYKISFLKVGGDWTRANELFANNEAMPAVGLAFLGALIFQWVLFRFLGNITSVKKKVTDRDLKYYGEKTMATIQRYADTNVTINNNPKVKFFYSFTDKYGNIHQGEDAIVIGKLEIGHLPDMKEREVFYMSQSPENSKFTTSLSPQSLAGCLNVVLIFEALIFSVILIAAYVAGIS